MLEGLIDGVILVVAFLGILLVIFGFARIVADILMPPKNDDEKKNFW